MWVEWYAVQGAWPVKDGSTEQEPFLWLNTTTRTTAVHQNISTQEHKNTTNPTAKLYLIGNHSYCSAPEHENTSNCTAVHQIWLLALLGLVVHQGFASKLAPDYFTRTNSLAYFDAPRSWPWNCAKIVQRRRNWRELDPILPRSQGKHSRSTKTEFAFLLPNIYHYQEAWWWFHQASLHHQINFATPVYTHILGAPWLGVTLVKYVWSVLFTCRLPAAPPFTSWYMQHEIYDIFEDRNAHLKVF